MYISQKFFVEWEMFKCYREKTRALYVKKYFFPENRAVYEVMWKKIWQSWTGH